MKRIIAVLLLFVFSCSVVYAESVLNGSVLSRPVDRGEFKLDAQVSYSTASEVAMNYPPEWRPLSDAGIDSINYIYVPIRLTFGLLENLSLRCTIPYASINAELTGGTKQSGSGLANVELEGLMNIINGSPGALSLSGLFKLRLPSGKKLADLATNELYVGTRSMDLLFAGLMSKKLGAFKGSMMLGYLLTNPFTEAIVSGFDFDVNITDQILYSFALVYPVNPKFEVGGEIWGAFSIGKEQISASGITVDLDYSNRDSIMFTPMFKFRANERFTVNGNIDLILSKTAANSLNSYDLAKLTAFTVGGTMDI
jgi:hypothetical protein